MESETDGSLSLERALAKTQADADAVIKAATAVSLAVKRLQGAAKVGDLQKMLPSITAADQAITALRQQFANAKDGWDFDEEAYFGSGSFVRELQQTAERIGVRIYEQDDRLYCYPSLVRVLPNDRAVEIDKKRERRLRPTVLVDQLRTLQKRPSSFRSEPFLESLFYYYEFVVAAERGRKGKGLFEYGAVVKLLDIYKLITGMPGSAREYSRPEFARDVYLLDQSGVARTREGYVVSFPVGTGSKTPANVIRIVTQEGREKLYYGIAFTDAR